MLQLGVVVTVTIDWLGNMSSTSSKPEVPVKVPQSGQIPPQKPKPKPVITDYASL